MDVFLSMGWSAWRPLLRRAGSLAGGGRGGGPAGWAPRPGAQRLRRRREPRSRIGQDGDQVVRVVPPRGPGPTSSVRWSQPCPGRDGSSCDSRISAPHARRRARERGARRVGGTL